MVLRCVFQYQSGVGDSANSFSELVLCSKHVQGLCFIGGVERFGFSANFGRQVVGFFDLPKASDMLTVAVKESVLCIEALRVLGS